jgi:hypothetical protein
VPLRVGPGEYRAVLGYLDTNQAFPVIEHAINGDMDWWRIEMLNVAQAWVNQKGITNSGDCALVPVVEAAPYVPPPPDSVRPTGGTPVPPDETKPDAVISFFADRTLIAKGECATLQWDVEGIKEVYYQGVGVVGHSSQQECPLETTTYTLQVVLLDGTTTGRFVTIQVNIADRDGDTVPDDQDKCPDQPGSPNNSGCPVRDYDGDTVPDDEDSCPYDPGPPENYGCPEEYYY